MQEAGGAGARLCARGRKARARNPKIADLGRGRWKSLHANPDAQAVSGMTWGCRCPGVHLSRPARHGPACASTSEKSTHPGSALFGSIFRPLVRSVFGSLAGLAIGGAAVGVLLGGDAQVGGAASLVVGVEFLEVGDAPTAAGPGAEAFGDQRRDRGILAFDERADLAEGYMEAQTYVVVGVHASSLGADGGVLAARWIGNSGGLWAGGAAGDAQDACLNRRAQRRLSISSSTPSASGREATWSAWGLSVSAALAGQPNHATRSRMNRSLVVSPMPASRSRCS